MSSGHASILPDRSLVGVALRALSPFLLVLLGLAVAAPAQAQTKRVEEAFYLRFGGGLSDYAGDRGSGGFRAFFGTDKFTDGDGFPYAWTGEFGYQATPNLGVGLAYQAGRYPLVLGNAPGTDPDRFTLHLLERYTFGARRWTVAPYLDAGVNATFTGTDIGFGPSLGGGVDIVLNRWASVYAESRFHMTFGDRAIDEVKGQAPFDVLSVLPGIGVKLSYKRDQEPPRILAVDGPTTVKTGESVTFSARVGEESTRPMQYQWSFGDGTVGAGLTETHTFAQPGTYSVTFTASNEAGVASESITVTVTRRTQPPRVISLDGPTDVIMTDEPVTFTATVGEGASRPLTYRWRFGDGGTASGLEATYTYDFAGTYEVTFIAKNEGGRSRKSTRVKVVRGRPLPARIASIEATPNPARPGQPVHFTSAVQGVTPLTYEWHFGDGTTAAGPSPSHTYDEPGQYEVRLEASNEKGEDTRTVTVRVGSQGSRTPARTSSSTRWTIVVASMRNADAAEAIARRYRDRFEALPVKVVTAQRGQDTLHRVSVGRFEGAEAARQALRAQREHFPSDAWLLRVR